MELFRQLRIADFVGVEIHHADAHAVLHFAFAEIVQMRPPLRVLFQVFGHMLGEQNVSGIATIHHPLRDVDARAGDVGLLVQVSDFVNRAAVNSHPDPKLGMALQRLAISIAHSTGASGLVAKNERATIAGGQAQQFAFRFGQAELLRSAHDLF